METYYFVIQLKRIGVKKSARRINHGYLVMLLQYQMLDTFSGIVDLGGPQTHKTILISLVLVVHQKS